MEALSILALFLFLLVGYSLGAILTVGRDKAVSPGLLDLVIILGLYVLALRFRHSLGRWAAIAVVLAAGVVISSVLTAIRRDSVAAPKSESTIISPDAAWWRRFYSNWKLLASDMGNYQGRLLLAIFYFTILTPWGLALRLLGDPLRTKPTTKPSYWVERSAVSSAIEDSRRMF